MLKAQKMGKKPDFLLEGGGRDVKSSLRSTFAQ